MITSQQRSAALDLLLRWDKDDSFDNHDAIDQLAAILQPAPPARQVDTPKPKCPDCNSVGMSHCSDPVNCGSVYWPDHIYRALKAEIAILNEKIAGIRGAYDRASQDLHDTGLEVASLKQQMDREREVLAGPVGSQDDNAAIKAFWAAFESKQDATFYERVLSAVTPFLAARRASLEKKEPELRDKILDLLRSNRCTTEQLADQLAALAREMEKKG